MHIVYKNIFFISMQEIGGENNLKIKSKHEALFESKLLTKVHTSTIILLIVIMRFSALMLSSDHDLW